MYYYHFVIFSLDEFSKKEHAKMKKAVVFFGPYTLSSVSWHSDNVSPLFLSILRQHKAWCSSLYLFHAASYLAVSVQYTSIQTSVLSNIHSSYLSRLKSRKIGTVCTSCRERRTNWLHIQKEVISYLKREHQFLSKEVWESKWLMSRERFVNRF